MFLTVEPQTWGGLPQALVSLLLGNKHCTFPDLGPKPLGCLGQDSTCDVDMVSGGTRPPCAHPALALHLSFQHPYPTEDEKRQIAAQTNLTLLQVNNW